MDVRSHLSAPPLIEILVHVSGPSAARDDLRYRAQAAAYLNFEPYRSKSLLSTEQQATGVADPVGVEGTSRTAPLDAASAAASGSAEKRDLPFWKDEDTEPTITSGSGIQQDHAAALPTTGTPDQASHTIAIPQLLPQITPTTGVSPGGQNALSKENEPASSDVQPPVHIQTSSSRPENTTPLYPPSLAKRQ